MCSSDLSTEELHSLESSAPATPPQTSYPRWPAPDTGSDLFVRLPCMIDPASDTEAVIDLGVVRSKSQLLSPKLSGANTTVVAALPCPNAMESTLQSAEPNPVEVEVDSKVDVSTDTANKLFTSIDRSATLLSSHHTASLSSSFGGLCLLFPASRTSHRSRKTLIPLMRRSQRPTLSCQLQKKTRKTRLKNRITSIRLLCLAVYPLDRNLC